MRCLLRVPHDVVPHDVVPHDPGPDDRGSITAFVVGITLALLLCAGLVYDGGRLIAARTTAGDHAENAARAGAQEIVSIRAGDWQLDPAAATARAQGFLALSGAQGSASATDRQVTVTVQRTTPMTLLAIVGVASRTVTVTRVAEAVDR